MVERIVQAEAIRARSSRVPSSSYAWESAMGEMLLLPVCREKKNKKHLVPKVNQSESVAFLRRPQTTTKPQVPNLTLAFEGKSWA